MVPWETRMENVDKSNYSAISLGFVSSTGTQSQIFRILHFDSSDIPDFQ